MVLVNFDFPYATIGIDYVRTVFVKNIYSENGKSLYKSWIVLTTCWSGRCTYLDVVPDSSGGSSIETLRCFISSF